MTLKDKIDYEQQNFKLIHLKGLIYKHTGIQFYKIEIFNNLLENKPYQLPDDKLNPRFVIKHREEWNDYILKTDSKVLRYDLIEDLIEKLKEIKNEL